MLCGPNVKQPVSAKSRVCCRKTILALLDQLTSFGQRESLTNQATSGSGRMSAVSSAQSDKMLQSVAASWHCLKRFGNQKFHGGHPSNYLWSQTLLNFNDYILSHIDLGYISRNIMCPSISRSLPFPGHVCLTTFVSDGPTIFVSKIIIGPDTHFPTRTVCGAYMHRVKL